MDLEAYKSGQFEVQLEYQSFWPSTIDHKWIFSDPALLTLLSEANRAVGELNAFSQLVPNVDFFIGMHVAKEATQSSRIEGTQTNMEDAFLDVDDIAPEARDDWQEVRNYIDAINAAIGRLPDLPLSNRLLKEAHSILMRGVRGETKRPGEFRVSQNWIGVSLKNAVFVPPHHTRVDELMSDMERFLHNDALHVPHLIKIAIAHYQFETIHPFLDGNGRLGRLMIALYLANFGLLEKPALYLSDYFERNKTAYVDHLMAVREGHHMRAWLIFFLHGVEETARASIQVFKDILSLKETIEREALPRFSTRRQENAQSLMQLLYANPVQDINGIAESLGVTQGIATRLVDDFVTYDILKETTGQRRNRIFVFHHYLRLFYEPRG